MIDLAKKAYMDISDDQAIVHPRAGFQIKQAMEIIEPARFIVTDELNIIDMPEHVAVAPARRRRREKPEPVTPKSGGVYAQFCGHRVCGHRGLSPGSFNAAVPTRLLKFVSGDRHRAG
jgi:hypothetical protein